MPRVAVIRFPGTNGDLDVVHALKNVVRVNTELVWYDDYRHGTYDAVVVPGGFSYGDWLRAGAIAARSRAMKEIIMDAEGGMPVLGICNGFQILVEAGLLPGALLPNDPPRFITKWVWVRVNDSKTPFTKVYEPNEVVSMPIAHGEGRYFIDNVDEARVAFTYFGENPNGSVASIAGVANYGGNVLGLMPHPERSAESVLAPRRFMPGGLKLWLSLRESLSGGW
ncbi:phosphoribosylformylglycinamidine synthase subunit PurQ [Vulcanisaeta souniana]|uniref:Phosphoribosylformylglycinamidine synthase subunit PurQ n=1 Tax=Vulcanisaeta souniana JCM 11219 TaxID=1293586 RepID=A0A830E3S7_9CREN|nr:phosphoribosylformylglycinamidine synthase subunit PurQ [Vulcanisaeta souniana]BDR91004.1 phosphoribosylformylglycinamidine synthase I [Vulcanisaeta souniana JCM 11219]GGI79942.1 phosphoribosylformylglycinamidine synthase I [Vulcanisaeta souniana JCM 11219]